MLSLRMGVWFKDATNNSSSGTFTLFGKKFVVFVDRAEKKRNPDSPDCWVTIKEHTNGAKD